MWRLRRIFAKFLNVLHPARAEQELSREIAAHLALLEDDFARQGMVRDDARVAARRAYGGVEQVKELHRDERSFIWLDQTLRDIRHAFRTLSANPSLTLVAVATLAMGIGVNATLFSLYNSVALKPLPIADPNDVFRMERWTESGFRGDLQYAFSYPEYEYCRDRNDVFAGVIAASWPSPVLVESASHVNAFPGTPATVQLVSGNYFTDLGVSPQLGRGFLPEERDISAKNAVAVISYPFWQRQFHGNLQALGTVIKVTGTALTIVGIGPRNFTGTSTLPQVPDLWAPLSLQKRLLPASDWLHAPDDMEFQMLARLRPSISFKAAQAEADSLIRQYATTFRPRDRTKNITLQHTAFFGNTDDIRFKAFVAAMMLLVGSVLLVACANLANMLLARGAQRQREIAVRLALGSSRGRVIRQLLTENILLALLGGIGGLLLSIWAAKLVWISIEQIFAGRFADTVVFQLDVSPDARVLAYALDVSLVTGIVFGLSPALECSRTDIASTLKDESNLLGQRLGHSRIRSFLVTTQVTVSMILLIVTGLLLRGVLRSQTADPGFETKNVIVLSGELGNDLEKGVSLERHLVDRLQTLPGVNGAALGTVPLLGTWTPPILIEGLRAPDAGSISRTLASYASDTYFQTLGIPLLHGRNFTKQEAASGAPVAVISESTARRFWPAQNPLGKRFKLDLHFQQKYTEFEVIGIAKDVRFANLTRIDPSHVYIPTGTDALYGVLLRNKGDLKTSMASVRSAAASLDSNLPPSLLFMTLENGPLHLQKSLAKIYALYAGSLAVLAMVLAGIGIYGVMSYLVSQRTAEIGIRMALGATGSAVLESILVQGLRATLIGIALGMAGAAALSFALHTTLVFPGTADLFYGVPFYDPVTFLGLPGFLDRCRRHRNIGTGEARHSSRPHGRPPPQLAQK